MNMNLGDLAMYEIALLVGICLLFASLVLLIAAKLTNDVRDRARRRRLDAMTAMLESDRTEDVVDGLLDDWRSIRDVHALLSEVPVGELPATSRRLSDDQFGYALADAAVIAGIEADFAADPDVVRAASEVEQLLRSDGSRVSLGVGHRMEVTA